MASLRSTWGFIAGCALAGCLVAPRASAQDEVDATDEPAAPNPPAPSTRADEPKTASVRLAVRAGGAVLLSNERPTGSTATIPIRVDVLRRARGSHFDVGASFEMGPAWVELVGYPATGTRGRVGVLAVAHFAKGRVLAPWLGMGGGIEFRTARGGGDQVRVDYDRFGLELARLELGGDIALGAHSAIAPALEAAFGRYVIDTMTPSNPMGGEVHACLGVGVRAAFE